MNRKLYFLIAAFLIPAMLFTGCKKDEEEPTIDAQKVMTTYLVGQNLDLNTILDKFVMNAPDNGDVSAKYVIDIRTTAEFAQGHIEGAIRVDLANILTEAAKATKPILVVCKTGQTATFATTLLRLSGYADAQALKWGMSGWNADFDVWSNNTASIADGHANWTSDAAPTNLTYANPKFTTTETAGAEILKMRVAAVLADGFKTTTADDVLNNPGNYFINNYFSEADYTGFGHIKGAYRIQPMLIGEGQILYLDPSKRITTYCYTGQTSGAITAFLRVLGYDAVSMMFGMNRLYHSSTAWTSNKWGPSIIKGLPYVTN